MADPKTPERIQGSQNLQVPQRHGTPPPHDTAVPMTPETAHKPAIHLSNGLGSPLEKTGSGSRTPAPPRTPGPPTLTSGRSAGLRPMGGLAMTPQHHRAQWHRNGRVSLGTSSDAVPPLPLQTFWLTKEQAQAIEDPADLRERLVKAIESSEMFERAARQFRSLATQFYLQNNLLSIETHENAQRREVESSITKREIERLIVDVMGYSDASINTDQIRRRLKRTRQRLKDMEDLMAVKDREILALQQQLRLQQQSSQQSQLQPQQHTATPTPQKSPQRPRPPPIDTNLVVSSSSDAHDHDHEPMSALELLASQVLSEQMRVPPSATSSTDNPLSGEKRRRPSSSSTISAMSDDDTLEDVPDM